MALDICTSIVFEIVKNLMNATIYQARYPFHFKKYVEELVKEKENLQSHRESIQDRVIKAEQDAQKVDIVVMKWLDETDILIANAVLLVEKGETNKRCCLGHCPNLIWRCHLAKKIKKKIMQIVDQGNKCKFEHIARPGTPLDIECCDLEGFVLFDSTKLACEQLLEALKDDEVSLFVDIHRIQGSIADELGVKLEGQDDQARAKSLWSKINSAGNILIILDDVWQRIDFRAIGIPFCSNFSRCKVLLTTRRKSVCTLLNCQRIVPLQLLDEKEAWGLFQRYACISSLTPDNMKSLAKGIAYECKGLAIAIVTVASTLKGKNLAEWEESLETLRESGWMNIEEGFRNPYKCLLFSYENLKDEDAKSIFLLCSVFPEDFEIDEEDLARYGIGLGLFWKLGSFKRARNRLSIAKDKLIDSCLLMKTDDGQHVKMHDLVRGVALWIAKEENWEIASGQRSVELIEACGSMEDNKIRYLWLDEVNSFSSQLHFPNLIFLHVRLNKSSLTSDCFKALLNLRVLVLKYKGQYFGRSPISLVLNSLTNLRFLYLERWELCDVSFVVGLKKLQSLTLRDCSFNNLPNEILELESFKLLDVRRCGIKENPYKLMARCSKLEELYFVENGQWVDEREHACDIFDIKGDSVNLERYGLEIGRDFHLDNDFWTSIRSIAIEHFDVSATNETIKVLVQRAESLCLKKIYGGCKNVIPEMMIERMGRIGDLTKLLLDDSEDLEFFVDLANHEFIQVQNVLSKLTELQVKNMKSLKAFYRGIYPKAHHMLSMCNLKVFKLYNCPLLTHVFTYAIAESLAMLEVFEVEGCDELKHIVTDEMQHNQQRSNLVFQKLKQLSVIRCEQMEYLITTQHNVFQSFQLASLNELCLQNLPNLISIFSENYYPRFSSLKSLDLDGCGRFNIKSLNDLVVGCTTSQELSSSVTQSTQMSDIEFALFQALQSVERIKIVDCSYIEHVFQLTGLPLNVEPTPLESSLTYLHLSRLSELRCIFKGPTQYISLHNLWMINIIDCKELKSIFTVNIVRDLPRLWYIRVERCDKLEQIIEEEEFMGNLEITSNSSSTPLFGSLNIGSFNLCSLYELQVRDCPRLKWLFTLATTKTLTSLEILRIERCGELEYAIKDDVRVDGKALLPNLKVLAIKECDKLEQIISGEQSFDSLETASNFSAPPPHRSQNIGSFNLCSFWELEVRDCPKLKWLFTFSTAKTLTSLNWLTIERCEGLEYIIKDERVEANKSEEIVHEDDGQAILPKLEHLYLTDLPNVVDVYGGLQFQSRKYLSHEVKNCPKLVPQSPERRGITSEDHEVEELENDTEEEKATEENNLVPYDLNKAAKNIILESGNQLESDVSLQGTFNFNKGAGPSGEAALDLSYTGGVAIPGLPLRPSMYMSFVQALPVEADPLSSTAAGEQGRDRYVDKV